MNNKEKTSFLIMKNWAITLMTLPEHETSQLVKKICNFEFGELEYSVDQTVEAIFQGIKPYLQENDEKWENTRMKRSIAGSIGGKASGESRQNKSKANQNEANVQIAIQCKAKQSKQQANEAVIDTVTDTVTVKHSPPTPSRTGNEEGGEENKISVDEIRKNIEYDLQIQKYVNHKDDKEKTREFECYKEVTNILFDIVKQKREQIKINKTDISYQMVIEKFRQLTADHIHYVLDQLSTCTRHLYNVRGYVTAILYNSIDTIEIYYTLQGNNDTNGQFAQNNVKGGSGMMQQNYDFEELEKKLICN